MYCTYIIKLRDRSKSKKRGKINHFNFFVILLFYYFILKRILAQTIFISTLTSKDNIFNEWILYIRQ